MCGPDVEWAEVGGLVFILLPSVLYALGLLEGRSGRVAFLAGLIVHALGIVLRGVSLGRVPLTEKHDNISFMAFAMALCYMYFRRQPFRRLTVTALPMIIVVLLVSLAYRPINTISPFMRSTWFYVHMFFYFLSFGFFGISAAIGTEYVISASTEAEASQYKAAAYGWILYSASLIAGSIWFYLAYGTYWLWTSRELWTTLAWFYWGLYLHLRLMRGFKGRPAAIAGIAGFAVTLFSYFGMGTVIPSPPTQF